MPQKPLLIFDGDCNFCRRWVARWKIQSRGAVEFAPYQERARDFPQIPPQKFQEAVYLIEPSGRVTRGAEAVFETLSGFSYAGKCLRLLYRFLPGFAWISEFLYSGVAANRKFFSKLTQLFWGAHLEPPSFYAARWIFLKGLALIYAAAFASLGVQILGLVGSKGILPAGMLLKAIASRFGPERFFMLPTLAWLNDSDFFLQFLPWGGVFLTVPAFWGICQPLIFFLLWISYLSLVSVGGDFLAFQWDNLLLEAGLLAVFWSPFAWKGGFRKIPCGLTRRLVAWLLFRLMFSSGVVKLASGDPSWMGLTALSYYYQTQPIVSWISWYFHHLPLWFHKISCVWMFFVELALPFLIFTPRRPRFLAFSGFLALHLLIMVSGNYCFFNLLSILLALTLLDDSFWPPRLLAWAGKPEEEAKARRLPALIFLPFAAVLFLVTAGQVAGQLKMSFRPDAILGPVPKILRPLRSANPYGLFAVMTTKRPEIILEGSRDGVTWEAYEFRYKAGDPLRRPGFVQPHQPRLDWQMWFAALGSYRSDPWIVNLCVRLLEGSPEVLKLLGKNPFPGNPPRYLRAVTYDYRFTDPETRRRTGAWWQREYQGLYLPPVSLQS